MQEAAARCENGTRQDPAVLDVFPVSAHVESGELALGGVRASELADRFGTPLVVYCEETLRGQARSLIAAARNDGRVFYDKAFANVALLRPADGGWRVSRPREFPPTRVRRATGNFVIHGNNKDTLARGRERGRLVVARPTGEAAAAASNPSSW
jgi:hypothetical protein